jgi:hypothetical protein
MDVAEQPAAGVSGSWVVRGDGLLGFVIAGYSYGQYLHMVTADEMFDDIKNFLAASTVTVASESDIKASLAAKQQNAFSANLGKLPQIDSQINSRTITPSSQVDRKNLTSLNGLDHTQPGRDELPNYSSTHSPGAMNPLDSASMTSLEEIYRNQGQWNNAEELGMDAMDIYKSIRG